MNGLDIIGKAVGLSGSEMRKIATEVKANQDRLNSCLYHEFREEPATNESERKKYRCQHCQGTISSSSYFWHEIGRRPQQ
ncbi:hypothetical protein SAMN02744783_04780 [Serratia sp. CC22-02]|nr:hypothetical protein SAMN02744783_04780 [Serratia sp. CC22-02]